MPLVITAEPVPPAADSGGVVRVGNSRVSLDAGHRLPSGADGWRTRRGVSPPGLGDLDAVIGSFHRRQPEVDADLYDRQRRAAEV